MGNITKTNDGWMQLQIDSDLKNLEVVADFIARTMRELGATKEKDVFDVQLAVDEALTNIIEHAYSGQPGGKIIICCRLLDPKKEYVIKLIDYGESFNSQAVAVPDTEAPLEKRKIGGLGIFFMKHLMQTVKYTVNDKENELTMTKVLS